MSAQQTSSVRRAMLAFLFAIGLTTAAMAETKPVNMKFSDPGNDEDAIVSVVFIDTTRAEGDPLKHRFIPVRIPANSNAQQKRNEISLELERKGYTVNNVGENGLTMPNIDSKVEVVFLNGGTMEHDVVTTTQPVKGESRFEGSFEPFTPDRQPAIFTAGIVTDVGELSATISAQELNFQTDGPIICQALFQRLAPRAPQYGAQINYAGDRLEVYFDPAYTVTTGGVVFGTSSKSEGCSGTLDIARDQNLHLELAGQCPGPVQLSWSGAPLGSTLGIVFAMNTGSYVIPTGPCAGTTLDLGTSQLRLYNTIGSGNGSGAVNAQAGPGACGGYVQLIAVPSCATSNVARVP